VVFWNRIGFANNQLILLSALSLYFIYRYAKDGGMTQLYLGCLFTGLSIVTEYTGLLNVAAIAVYLSRHRPGRTLQAVALSLLPVSFLFAFMLYYTPGYFLFDVAYQLHRFFSPIKLAAGIIAILAAYKLKDRAKAFYRPIAAAMGEDTFIYVAVISLMSFNAVEYAFWHATTFLFTICFFGMCMAPAFLIEGEKQRHLIVLFLAAGILSMLAFDRTDHMTMVVYPFVSLGLAGLLYATYAKTLAEAPKTLRMLRVNLNKKMVFAACFYPLAVSACLSTYLFAMGGIDSEPMEQIREIAAYINSHTSEGDVVLTYSWMFPLITKARVGLITEAIAYEGIPIAYYSGDFPKDRFDFNTSFAHARLIIGANGTSEWIVNQTGARDIAGYIDEWNKTYVAGFLIYRNPAYDTLQ
jgi:hypothetical protein